MLGAVVGDVSVNIRNPLKRDGCYIAMAHDDLPEVVNAVVWCR